MLSASRIYSWLQSKKNFVNWSTRSKVNRLKVIGGSAASETVLFPAHAWIPVTALQTK